MCLTRVILMEQMLDFYNTLFSIQVTIVGIGVAAIIAIAQILQSFLIYKNSRKLFEAPDFIVMVSVFIGGLLVTGGASLMLAFPDHDFFPNQNYCINYILENPFAALLILLMIPLSIILLGWFIYKETRYLVPSEALRFYTENYDHSAFSEYLKYRYGRPPAKHQIEVVADVLGVTVTNEHSGASQTESLNYEKRLVQHEEMRKTNKGAENPLAPIESYIMQSIQRSDTTLLIRSLMSLEAIYLNNPSSSQYVKYYCDVMRNSTELAITQGLHTALSHILDSIERVASDVISHDQLDILSDVLDLMKDSGDDFRKRDQEALKKLLGMYRNIGERLFDIKSDAKQERIDDIIRDVSWLGERFIDDMDGLERTPLMFSGYYETPLNSLINCLWGIGQKFDNHKDTGPMQDSRIFLDAMYVIARTLEGGYDSMKTSEQDEEVYNETYHSLMSEHERIFEIAIRKNGKREATLALIKIKDFLTLTQEAYDSKQEEENSSSLIPRINLFSDDVRPKWHMETLNSVFRIGVMAARFSEKLGKPEQPFINDTYIDEVLRIIQEYGADHDFKPEAREALIKCGPENDAYEAVKAYIKKVGRVLETDFGMDLS